MRDAAVADVHRPHTTRHRIKMFLARSIPDPHALAFDDDPGINRLKLFVLDQVVPKMRLVRRDHITDVIPIAVHVPTLLYENIAASHGKTPGARLFVPASRITGWNS